MFHATLAVQLPAALPQPSSTVRQLIERQLPLPEGDERDDPHERVRDTLLDNFAVFEVLLRGFEDAGFDDVVAIVVDGKPMYVDTEERIGDLQLALERVLGSESVAEGFAVMRTTFCRRHDGLELLAELRCHARSDVRSDETRVRVSARPVDHAPLEGEDPKAYATRVRSYVQDHARIEAQRVAVEQVRDRLAERMRHVLSELTVDPSPVTVRFVAPGRRQLGRMRHLTFGARARGSASCALPSYERTGPYDDPLSRNYYSQYGDLFHWLAVGEVLAGHLPSEHVEVVSATGRRLFRGPDAKSFDPSEFSVSRSVVRVSPEGRLKIDASVPEVAPLDTAEQGSPHSRGWGGEAWADDIEEDAG